MSDKNYDFLKKSLEKYSINELSKILHVNSNTIKRWLSQNKVPSYYFFDLCNLLNVEISYDDFSYQEKDQFFTEKSNVKKCISILKKKLEELGLNENDYTYIEPSAGDGSFFNELPKDRRIGIDIEPKCDEVISGNFLKWYPKNDKKYITIGNPPFGLRGNLALRFINHASKFSDFVVFILPQLFESSGKGNCKDRVTNLNLIHTEKIDSNFYYPDGTDVNVNVVFQVWSKNYKKESKRFSCSDYIKIYSVSDGGSPSTTRNKKMINNCHYYLPTTCFEEKMKIYEDFYDLPQNRGYGIIIKKDKERVSEALKSINWKEISFSSTNSALNLRFDLIEDALINYGIINN